jgi:hypothetical protein
MCRSAPGLQHPPRLAVAVSAMRPHRLDHETDEHVAQRLDPAVADQAEPDAIST